MRLRRPNAFANCNASRACSRKLTSALFMFFRLSLTVVSFCRPCSETQAEGYVLKRGRLLNAWKKYYMVLRDNTLYFFASMQSAQEARSKPSSVISCDLIRVYEDTVQDDRFLCIELANLEKDSDRIVLGMSSEEERQYWVRSIKQTRKKNLFTSHILSRE